MVRTRTPNPGSAPPSMVCAPPSHEQHPEAAPEAIRPTPSTKVRHRHTIRTFFLEVLSISVLHVTVSYICRDTNSNKCRSMRFRWNHPSYGVSHTNLSAAYLSPFCLLPSVFCLLHGPSPSGLVDQNPNIATAIPIEEFLFGGEALG